MPTVSVFVPNLLDTSIVTAPKVQVTETGHGRSVGDMIEFSGTGASTIDTIFSLGVYPNTKPNQLTGRQIISEIVDADKYNLEVYYGISTAASQSVSCDMEPVTAKGVRGIATAGSTLLTIIEPNHDVETGQYVSLSQSDQFQQGWTDSRALNEIYEQEINGVFEVTEVLGLNQYKVDLKIEPTNIPASNPTGYTEEFGCAQLLKAGVNTSVLGPGWSSGTWSRSGWSTAVQSLAGEGLRIWHVDNFGEDLVMNVRDLPKGIFYWDASSGIRSRAFPLSNFPGVKNPPTIATQTLVSEVDRHILCLGVNPIFETQQDPMLIRWSSQEDPGDWTPTATNTAGDLRLSQGSRIVVGQKTRRETLVFTDRALFSMQYIGAPYTFGTAQLADNVRIAGPNAVTAINDSVFWMGFENFFTYNGRVQPVPCSVRSYVFDDINRTQLEKVYCATIASENEIWWFYPSANSAENDRYVSYNFIENLWVTGDLERTAFIDGASTIRKNPQGVDPRGFMYNHELGTTKDFTAITEGTENNVGGPSYTVTQNQDLGARIESSYFDIGEGDKRMFVSKILPDLNMNSSTIEIPEVDISMRFVDDINQSDNLDAALTAVATSLANDILLLNFVYNGQTPQEYYDQWSSGLYQFQFNPFLYFSTNINDKWDGAVLDDIGPVSTGEAGAIGVGNAVVLLQYAAGDQISKTYTDTTANTAKKCQFLIDKVLSTNITDLTLTDSNIDFFGGRIRYGAGLHRNVGSSITTTQVTPFEDTLNIRNRGRHMKLEYRTRSDAAGTAFTVGDTRIDIREDGKR